MLERSAKVRLIALILAGFLLAGAADAWSQQPPPETTQRQPTDAQGADPTERQIQPIILGESAQDTMADSKKKPAIKVKRGPNDGRERKNAKEAENGWAGWAWARNPIMLFNALIVLFTGALAISTVLLWWETKKTAAAANRSAQIAEDSLLKLQRAFINFGGMRYISHESDDGSVWWSLHFNWSNAGATPARGVRLYIGRYFEDADLPDDYQFGIPENLPENFVGPRAQITSTNWILTADDLIAVKEKRKFLYFWGLATYRDAFEGTPERITKFSLQVLDFRGDPSRKWDEKANIVEIILNHAPSRHNCADGDCP